MLSHALQSSIFPKPVYFIEDHADAITLPMSWPITRVKHGEHTLFFIDRVPESPFVFDARLPYDLRSDIWVLRSSTYPDFLPLPSKAIVFIGQKKPGKKLRTLAYEENLPLVSFSKTGGGLLYFADNDVLLFQKKHKE